MLAKFVQVGLARFCPNVGRHLSGEHALVMHDLLGVNDLFRLQGADVFAFCRSDNLALDSSHCLLFSDKLLVIVDE